MSYRSFIPLYDGRDDPQPLQIIKNDLIPLLEQVHLRLPPDRLLPKTRLVLPCPGRRDP